MKNVCLQPKLDVSFVEFEKLCAMNERSSIIHSSTFGVGFVGSGMNATVYTQRVSLSIVWNRVDFVQSFNRISQSRIQRKTRKGLETMVKVVLYDALDSILSWRIVDFIMLLLCWISFCFIMVEGLFAWQKDFVWFWMCLSTDELTRGTWNLKDHGAASCLGTVP